MERKDFIKLITAGGVALAISPLSLVPNVTKGGYTCGLFFKNKELNYKSYERVQISQPDLFDIKPIISKGSTTIFINIPDSVFPLTSEAKAKIDEIRIYRNVDNELMIIYQHPGNHYWTVCKGVFTVAWNPNSSKFAF